MLRQVIRAGSRPCRLTMIGPAEPASRSTLRRGTNGVEDGPKLRQHSGIELPVRGVRGVDNFKNAMEIE